MRRSFRAVAAAALPAGVRAARARQGHSTTASLVRPAWVAALAALLALALPAPALGHAELVATAPERGAQLAEAPRAVTFRFNEAVEASLGAVRVFDGEGERVDGDRLLRPRATTVGVALPGDLGPGTYTATYRVVSADGHTITGGVVFVVGRGGASAVTVSELLAEGDAGPVTTAAFGVVRALAYAAMALALGGLLFLLAVWGPALRRLGDASAAWQAAAAAFAGRARALVAAGVALGIVTSVLGLAFQGAVAGGTPLWEAFDPAVLDAVLETRFGTVWAVRGALWLVLGLVLVGPRPPVAVPALLAVGIALTPGLAGHASTASPAWLVVGADALHVLAMSAWVGAIVFLLAALPRATRRLAAPDRTRALAASLAGVSPIALAAVLVLLGTGLAQSVAQLGALEDVWETGFGRAILVKAVLFVALAAVGAHHRRRSLPRLRALAEAREAPAGAGRRVRRALRGELVLFAGVLAATSVLVAASPAAAPGVLSERVSAGGAEIDVSVEPLRTGPNEMHFYLFDGADGSRLRRVPDLAVELRQPEKGIGPIAVPLDRAGPGHFVATRADIGVPGDWVLTIRVRLSKFDVQATRLPLEIR